MIRIVPVLKIGIILLCTGFVAGCAPKTQYTWGDYGPALYSLYSGDKDLDATALKLQKIIEKGEVKGTVPPGIYAEYGYILLSLGKSGEAITFFQKEKQLYPESTVFMDRMIAAAKIPTAKPSAQIDRPELLAAKDSSHDQTN